MLKKEILVEISPQIKYPIFIDNSPIKNIEDSLLDYTKANKLLLVISQKVEKLYGRELNFKNSIKFVLKDGENQKNFKNYKKILDFALKNKLERKDAIVAIGGGVVGDLAGFVASTYLRGIDFIQIPTTLLACVDSSVGGKVGINTSFGKNLVGAFYQPKAVFCNLNFLKTLDDRQFKTGLAEVIKYAFISKNCGFELDFLEFLTLYSDKIPGRDEKIIAKIIEYSLSMKTFVVTHDEKESGLRKVLNFGHTYGHAVEKITNYKKYTHGEAVSVGMVFALNLAFQKGLISSEYKDEGIKLINSFNILDKTPKFEAKKMVEIMLSDKKVEDGKIKFVLPSSDSYVELLEINPNDIG